MIDIVVNANGDLDVIDTQVNQAANILNCQLGSLEYEQDLGIDLNYFLSPDFKFQDSSFQSYIVQVLANNGINVATIAANVENLFQEMKINLSAEDKNSGLIAR